ncbi:unnamed protein product [Heterobilharzia americana]|nr:unnamed protein product [Heterobilharzia americana]
MISYHYKYGFYLSDKDENTESSMINTEQQHQLSAYKSFNQRKYIVKELVKTQIDFTLDMKTVLSAFNSITMEITESDRYALLGNLEHLTSISDNISMELQKEIDAYPEDQISSACVAKCMNSSKSSLNEALKAYISPEIQKYALIGLKQLQNERPNVLTLNNELIKPVQRLVKLKQLFELLKEVTPINHPDCTATMQMFANFNELAYEVNEVKRWKDLCANVSDERHKVSVIDMVDKSTRRILTKIIRNTNSDVNRKTQQKFNTEREAINELEKSCTLLRNAVDNRYKKMQESIITQRNFIIEMKNIFLQNNTLKIYSDIPIVNNNLTYEFPMELIKNYEIALDTLIVHLHETYMKKLSSSVLCRLDKLNLLLNHSKGLLKKYDNTELDILLLDASIKHQNKKNSQVNAAIYEQKEESQRTLSTLQSGLQTFLPQLIKYSKSILQTACQYSYIIQTNIMQEFGNLIEKLINESEQNNTTAQPILKVSSTEIIQQIDKMKSLLPERKHRQTRKSKDELILEEKANTFLQEIAALSKTNRNTNSDTSLQPIKMSSKESANEDCFDALLKYKSYTMCI